MTEAYLIEDGEITEPIREGNLIGNGPAVLREHRRRRQRLRHGQPRHVRQGRPGRARRRRRADPAGAGAHRRRHRVTTARRRARARSTSRRSHRRAGRGPGEQVEAVSCARSTSTAVQGLRRRGRESLTSAELGRRRRPGDRRPPRGLRLRRHPRRGVVARDARRGARQRRRSASPTSSSASPTPDGVERGRPRPVAARASPHVPTDRQGRAGPRARARPRGRDPRVQRRRVASTATRSARARVATSTGIRAVGPAAPACLDGRSALAAAGRRDPDRLRLLGRAARSPTCSTSTRRPTTPCSAATRLLGATKPATQRLTLVLEPRMTATILGIVGGHAQRRGRAQGPVAVRRPRRRGGRVAAAHLRRRPHRPPLARRRRPRRRGPGPPPQRAHRATACCRGSCTTPTPAAAPAPPPPARPCARPRSHAVGGRAGRSAARPGHAARHDELLGARRARPARAVDDRPALGRQPGERRLLGRRRGPDDPAAASWPSRSARSPSPRRSSACCSTSSAVGADLEWLRPAPAA